MASRMAKDGLGSLMLLVPSFVFLLVHCDWLMDEQMMNKMDEQNEN